VTKWADPVDNPEQNARYWRERRAADWIFYVVILGVFAVGMGCVVWQTHRAVQCITGEVPRTDCDD
jgi:hypothetical protein